MYQIKEITKRITTIYPTSSTVLGPKRLTNLILDFSKTLDENKNLDTYILKIFPKYITPNILNINEGYLIDLIKFESLIHESFINIENGPNLSINNLLTDLQKTPDQIKLLLSSSVKFMNTQHPLIDIRDAILNNVPNLQSSLTERYFVIDHIDDNIRITQTNKIIFHALKLISQNKNLEEIAGELFVHSDPAQFESTLKEILSSLWIKDYSIS